MKRTLILSIVALAILAFVTPAYAEPCAAQNMDIVDARKAVATAEENLRTAQGSDAIEIFTSALGQSRYTGGSYLSVHEAKKALEAAKKALAAAEGAYETCLGSYVCGRCNQLGDDHLASTQPNCSHRYVVYTCDSDANTHNQIVCPGCNATYWQCGSSASNHVQVTCSAKTFMAHGALRSVSGCRVTYWQCKNASSHSIVWRGLFAYRRCQLPSSSSSSGSGGSGSGSGSGSDSTSTPTNTPNRQGSSSSGQTWRERIYRDKTCRRCGATFNRGNNGTCNSRWGTTYPSHWGTND